jgi:hypothetical protein
LKHFVVHKEEGEQRERDKRVGERNGFYVSCKCSVENLVSDFTTRDATRVYEFDTIPAYELFL